MVGMQGFEPWASCSRSKHSTRLSYIPRTVEWRQFIHRFCRNATVKFTIKISVLLVIPAHCVIDQVAKILPDRPLRQGFQTGYTFGGIGFGFTQGQHECVVLL